ncbi:hypothetical protein JB92DRAFT_3144963 [Gautieria morchelliformis]|nr:hypothetical protein JB92DRAFT_3144963 [Gautieria morchelliformis]
MSNDNFNCVIQHNRSFVLVVTSEPIFIFLVYAPPLRTLIPQSRPSSIIPSAYSLPFLGKKEEVRFQERGNDKVRECRMRSRNERVPILSILIQQCCENTER